jgi:surface polysaccharide O-acyltransferase-like enzyme
MDTSFLSITTLFLFIPILFFLNNNNHNNSERFLVFLLIINISLSFYVWAIEPIQNSDIHFYDGLFAKVSVFIFTIYILFIKQTHFNIKLSFTILLVISFYFFYYSNYYSSREWGSQQHVKYHSVFHFIISIGCTTAFL